VGGCFLAVHLGNVPNIRERWQRKAYERGKERTESEWIGRKPNSNRKRRKHL